MRRDGYVMSLTRSLRDLPLISRSHAHDSVSLRLGHARALTPHRGVIHYPRAASLPTKGRPWVCANNLRPAGHRRCHPEWSEAESNFFVRDPKLRFAPFDPRYARISTTLRMTRTKKHRVTRGGISAGIWLGANNLLRRKIMRTTQRTVEDACPYRI